VSGGRHERNQHGHDQFFDHAGTSTGETRRRRSRQSFGEVITTDESEVSQLEKTQSTQSTAVNVIA
jgi:hypothetical protein